MENKKYFKKNNDLGAKVLCVACFIVFMEIEECDKKNRKTPRNNGDEVLSTKWEYFVDQIHPQWQSVKTVS